MTTSPPCETQYTLAGLASPVVVPVVSAVVSAVAVVALVAPVSDGPVVASLPQPATSSSAAAVTVISILGGLIVHLLARVVLPSAT